MTQRLIGSVTTPFSPRGNVKPTHSQQVISPVLTEKIKASNSSLALLNNALGSCPYSPSFLPTRCSACLASTRVRSLPSRPLWGPLLPLCVAHLHVSNALSRAHVLLPEPGLLSSGLPSFSLCNNFQFYEFSLLLMILPLHPLFSVPVFVLNPVTSSRDCQAHPLNWPVGLPAASSPD